MFPQQGFADRHDERVLRMVDMIAEQAMSPALHGGFTGASWVIEHTEPSDPDDDGLVSIDEGLREVLSSGPWRGDYDLISGLVGFAVYALERGARPEARACLRLILDQLIALARKQPQGVAWWSEPYEFAGVQRVGCHNLGVAHGVPGVVAVLAQMCAIPELAPRARALLDDTMTWLLSQRLPSGEDASFSFSDVDRAPARSAWCYGDPGIAPTLIAAGRLAGNPAWEKLGVEIGIHATQRPIEHTRVIDAGICHGAAGLAHLYGRLFHATNEPVFGEAARAWITRTLEMRRPGAGIAGYLSWNPGEDGKLTWLPDPSFLTGTAGIALVLMAAVADREPCWDRTLLCTIPPAS
jgi:hypothetical protein